MINWDKPIRLLEGHPARLLGVLEGARWSHVIAWTEEGKEYLKCVNYLGIDGESVVIENVPENLVKYKERVIDLIKSGDPKFLESAAECVLYCSESSLDIAEPFDSEIFPEGY